MTDRPILFSAPMVRAILDGRKSQTRRVLRVQPDPAVTSVFKVATETATERAIFNMRNRDGRTIYGLPCRDGFEGEIVVPYGAGDRLWVRETWSHTGDGVFEISQARIAPTGRVIYAATPASDAPHAKYWPSIHMPREFSRLTLVVTEVRVERLQDISDADAIAEGSTEPSLRSIGGDLAQAAWSERQVYQRLWDHLNVSRGYGWDANPWVVALTFTVHHQNIDAPGAKEAA